MHQDLRFAFRMLLKDPWFSLTAMVALGLGIGLNATVFTFVNAVLIRPLPFPDAQDIVHANGRNTATGNTLGISWPDFEQLRQARSFSGVAAYRNGSFTISEIGRPPERVSGVSVSANTFSLLRQEALHGRGFVEGEDRPEAPPAVILGYGIWQSRYAGDPSIVGRVIKVNDVACTVVGVMPEGMKFPNRAELWRPLVPEPAELTRRDARPLNLFGRLASGVSRRQADAELNEIARRMAAEHPQTNQNVGVELLTFNERFNGGNIRVVFLCLLGAVGFVLLVACANVANLLLARSAARAREIAVRFALGATRMRVVRQLLVESVLLAALGGVLGIVLAHFSVRLFDAAVADVGKPYWIRFTFDPLVFAYFAAICLATGIIFGLAPALQVSRTSVNDVLKEGGRGTAGTVRSRRLVSAMVVAELALTVVLLVGAGLMIRSFLKLSSIEIGVQTSPILTMRLQLPGTTYEPPEKRRLFYDQLVSRVAAVPGVQAAAVASAVPFEGVETRELEIDGRATARENRPRTSIVYASPGYFDVMGVSMLRGRTFLETDRNPGAQHAIVNERFARQYFPGKEAIGNRIRLISGGNKPEPGPWLTIIGVSPTIRQGSMQNAEPDAVVYQPYRLQPPGFARIITRSQVPAASLTGLVREAVQAVDPDLPVFDVQTLDAIIAQSRWPYRVFGTMFTIFAIIALVLSAVGVYGVTAYSVTQRTPEIGVRMALGARSHQVSWLILRRGLMQLAIGLTLGLILAWFTSTLLGALLVQVPTRDPVTFAIIVCVLAAATLAACLIPARRATRLDPLAALRAE